MKSTVYSKLAKSFDLLSYAYAHRGLWLEDGPPENSLAAFCAAADIGLGLEMDVRPSADGTPMCFHDPLLDRVTDATGLISEHTTEALSDILLENDEPIPTLLDLLDIWPHALPILVEMKIDGETDATAFSQTVSQLVGKYPGKAAIISFDETAVAAVPDHIMTGQLIPPTWKIGAEAFAARLQRARTAPAEFLALHVSDADAGIGTEKPCVCWTVRREDERRKVRRCGHAEIFDQVPPPLAAT